VTGGVYSGLSRSFFVLYCYYKDLLSVIMCLSFDCHLWLICTVGTLHKIYLGKIKSNTTCLMFNVIKMYFYVSIIKTLNKLCLTVFYLNIFYDSIQHNGNIAPGSR